MMHFYTALPLHISSHVTHTHSHTDQSLTLWVHQGRIIVLLKDTLKNDNVARNQTTNHEFTALPRSTAVVHIAN